jgi:hypothetical protein
MLRSSSAVLIALLFAASPALAFAEVKAAWVELTGSGAEARATTDSGVCPTASLDGKALLMAVRTPGSADFPMVCSVDVPAGTQSLRVEGRTLPLPKPATRIVVLGDSGCHIKDLAAQACNDSRAWPLATVARLAAAQRPDLVIHVGDYYYRETPCLAAPVCGGSPYGDRWDTWAAELFDPAAPLIQAAPWIFARGNHELCSRGGRGWFVLLDAGPVPEGCPIGDVAPFTVKTGDLALHVIDSSAASDRGHSRKATADMVSQLDRLGAALDLGQGWIVTHRPIWGLVPVARLGPADPFEVGLNFTEQDAVRGRSLKGVQMIVSGHVHHFQSLDFGPARPAQLVVGTGGDSGIKADKPQVYGGRRELDGMDAETFTFSRFGYYLLLKDGQDWTGEFHDQDDVVRALCRLHARNLTCKAPR